MPCQDLANETISCLPVTSLAIRMAASFDSAPVVSSSAFSSGSGSVSARRRARSTTGRLSMPLNRWSSLAACRVMVATISGCEWPWIRRYVRPRLPVHLGLHGEQWLTEERGVYVDAQTRARGGRAAAVDRPGPVSGDVTVGPVVHERRHQQALRAGAGREVADRGGDQVAAPH